MDKYEYKLRTEQMLKFKENKSYDRAAEIADTIDWKRVKNVSMLTSVSDIYEMTGEYEKCYNVLKIASERETGGRKTLYRMGMLAIRLGSVEEAIDYYDEYMQIAPKDPNQYILRYKILRAQRAPVEQQIEALEEFKKAEYIEEWAYELAKLYQEAGMTAECLEECDDLILWFSEGQYVYQAMELKMQYKPLTPSQMEKYNSRHEKMEEEPVMEGPAASTADTEPAKETEPEPEETAEKADVKVSDSAKSSIGNTMKLREALESLLKKPEATAATVRIPDINDVLEKADIKVNDETSGESESTEDGALEEVKEENKAVPEETPATESEPIMKPEPKVSMDDEQIEGQLNIADILAGWEESVPETTAEEVKEETSPTAEKEESLIPEDIQKLLDELEGIEPPKTEMASQEEPMADIQLKDVAAEPSEDDFEEYEEETLEDDIEEEESEDNIDEYEEEELEDAIDEYEEEELEDAIDEYEEEELEDAIDEYEEEELEDDLDQYEEEELEEIPEEYEEEAYEEEADWEDDFKSPSKDITEKDDREIEDDDVPDLLAHTTPLSRKETAKMIATGKTAPLPVDEISDALSMSDTGFIVHGRYDLETQSGVGTRAGLTEEQKKLFSYFVPVRGMSEQLVDVLEQDKNCTNRLGTSRTGNLLIIGRKGSGKTVLAVDVVKAIQRQRNIKQGKVAIVTGDSLNKKKISDIVDKLYGGALIIEKAGKMNERTVAKLNRAMERETGELLIVLEEQRKPLDRLLSSNREFRRKFTCRLEVPIFINDELVTFGQTYARENGYRIDEMGILALYSRIDALQREDHPVTVAEVKEIMDEAIEHSQKTSAKKLVKRVFGKGTDEADRIILSEKDFNI